MTPEMMKPTEKGLQLCLRDKVGGWGMKKIATESEVLVNSIAPVAAQGMKQACVGIGHENIKRQRLQVRQ